jgi:hypothetical protein
MARSGSKTSGGFRTVCTARETVCIKEQDTLWHVFHCIDVLEDATMGRGILLWLLGVPIPIIILLWLFFGR